MITFVLTLVPDAADALRGRLRCVRTGEELPFASGPELLDVLESLRAVTAAPVRPDPPPGRGGGGTAGDPARGP